eukprot:TRINITY_DN26475_c0_g1_i1.p1 TRINITY_DN26475_c0_g1~~TRINITY_DN26475_c0_g1_i1.p1  ORF type:complete len:147 (-),score=15.18 TRINITY_DN26475_c0_g1_i1:937-1377(-)
MAPTPANGYTSVTHSVSQERDDGGDQSRRRLSIDTYMCLPAIPMRPLNTGRGNLSCLATDHSAPTSPDCSLTEEDDFASANEGCETPKGKQYRLPNVLSCPPAPRKPRIKSRRKVAMVGDNFFTPDYSAIDDFFTSMESKLPLFKK